MVIALPGRTQELPLSVAVTSGEWIGEATPLEMRPSRALQRSRERLFVLIGARDVTAQLEFDAETVRFRNAGVPLPPGEYELVVWHVAGDTAWREVLRQPVRVERAFGVRTRKLERSVDVGLKARFRTDAMPPNANDRVRYHDVDGQVALDAEVSGRNFRVASRATVLGTSHRANALRFGQRQDEAPLLDLASYLVQYRVGSAEWSLGQLSSGSQRHLIDNFASRGAGLRLTRGRIDATLAAVHGSNLVGWDDALGFTNPDHRIVTGQLALEAFPTAGVLRVELTTLNGSLLPLSGFTQAAVTDAERSDGLGARVTSAMLAQRVRVEAGIARSRFELRPDPTLGAPDSLVSVPRETRQARYLDVAADLLRWGSRRGAAGHAGSLALGYAHERIDPLYRTAGAYVQSDRLLDRVNVRATAIGFSLGVHYDRSQNNLNDIPSILTTRTRRTGADLTAPLGSMLGKGEAWLPALAFRFGRTHQRGLSLPTEGGFDSSHIPDQISDEGAMSLSWQGARGSLTLQANGSAQDNRQPGRERADLRSSALGAQVLATPHRRLAVSADVAWTTARNLERSESEHTTRFAIGPTLNPAGPVTLQLQYATNATRNRDAGSRRDDAQLSAQLSATLPRPLAHVGNWFLRYARQDNDAFEPVGQVEQRLRHWTVDGGLTLTLR